MYLVAICDDMASELNKTEQLLEKYKKDHPGTNLMIERFENADTLLTMVREGNYRPDLIFLDIYMPDKSGISAARDLRDLGNESKIIFLTTSKEHALEAFSVDAVQYLVKPISETTLFEVLDKLLKNKEEERRYLLLRTEGCLRRVAAEDIVYCEAQGKKQRLYLVDGTFCLLRTTMTEFCRMIADYQEFARLGVSYVVNLEHIESLNARELQMDNGRIIYLPRGSYQSLRERYFGYYCEEG